MREGGSPSGRVENPRVTLGIYAHVLGDAHREAVEKVAPSCSKAFQRCEKKTNAFDSHLSQDLYLSLILELVCPSIVARSSGADTAWAPEIPRNCIVLETLRKHEVQYDFVL
jgi:hypothetical protein